MERGKWNSTFSYWKEIEAHNCTFNSPLSMGCGWFMEQWPSG